MSRKQVSTIPLYEVVKTELKARGLTYRDVAKALGASENSMRLRFANRRLSMEQFMAIAELLELTMAQLLGKLDEPPARQLTPAQEAVLVRDTNLLLVIVRVLDGWSIADIVATYDLTEAEVIKYLLQLDRIGLIELLPQNVIRFRVRRTVEWLPDGALHRLIEARIPHFLNNKFNDALSNRFLSWSRLTPAAIEILHTEMRRLRSRLEALHEECKIAPSDQLHDIVVLLAEREWELPDFSAIRHKPLSAR